jgi:hypothetical protein
MSEITMLLHTKILPTVLPVMCFASFFTLLALTSVSAQSLQPGFYWGGGSRYITIARQKSSDRLCYQSSSNYGGSYEN